MKFPDGKRLGPVDPVLYLTLRANVKAVHDLRKELEKLYLTTELDRDTLIKLIANYDDALRHLNSAFLTIEDWRIEGQK